MIIVQIICITCSHLLCWIPDIINIYIDSFHGKIPYGNDIVEISLHLTFEFNFDSIYFCYQETNELTNQYWTSDTHNLQ